MKLQKDMQVRQKTKLDKKESTNKQKKIIKRSNTKLVLVQAKLRG